MGSDPNYSEYKNKGHTHMKGNEDALLDFFIKAIFVINLCAIENHDQLSNQSEINLEKNLYSDKNCDHFYRID